MKLSLILTLALVGTAVTLLFTTKKGGEYREDALESAKQWREKLRHSVAGNSDGRVKADGATAHAAV